MRLATLPRSAWLFGAFALAPLCLTAALAWGPDVTAPESAREPVSRELDYAGSTACRACHPDHHASWRRTFHSRMNQWPSRETVLGRFDGVEVELFGGRARPIERDGRFCFELPPAADRPARTAEVALCVGSHRYQQYFERVADGEHFVYRRLPLLWHVEGARWMHLNGVFLEPDSDDWTAHEALWNENCIFCHTTGAAPGLDLDGRERDSHQVKRFDSHVGELGIACEACHGPGQQHVEEMRSPLARYARHLSPDEADVSVLDPTELWHTESNAVCGQCHSQRLPARPELLWSFLDTGPTFRPGENLEAHVTPITHETPSLDPQRPELFRQRFWGDGTARLTAYEYLGLTQSKCAENPFFTCNECHSMHSGDVSGQLEPAMRTDAACASCHLEIARDPAAHAHHATDSPGARCLDCHMPRVVYGVLEIHRSHRVDVPDVARDVEAGRPNACALCHVERSATDLAAAGRTWWGDEHRAPRSRPDGAPLEVPALLADLHAGDAVQRAVAAAALGRLAEHGTREQQLLGVAHAIVALGDGYPSVRWLARRSLAELLRSSGLGLESEVAAYDHQAPLADRKRALDGLLAAFAPRVRTLGVSLPVNALVRPDGTHDLEAIVALLDLQSANVISIGE